MFIVIRVLQYRGLVKGVNLVAKFDEEGEAERYIANVQRKTKEERVARTKYIDEWVHALPLPGIGSSKHEWSSFVQCFLPWQYNDISREEFREQLACTLRRDPTFEFRTACPIYDPPEVVHDERNLFVVRIAV
jgi:hypothetical protein